MQKARQALLLAGLFAHPSFKTAGPKLRTAPQAAALAAEQASLPQSPFAAVKET